MTRVMFRVWRGGIIALFPDNEASKRTVWSYQAVGQHAGAKLGMILNESRAALPAEYERLKTELESEGYELEVVV